MSADLVDFRFKLNRQTNAVLEAHAKVTGKDKSEIVRAILHEWASDQITIARAIIEELDAPPAEEGPRRVPLTRSERAAVWERHQGCCHYCGILTGDGGWHVDHVIPVAQGGTNAIDNLVVACVECNLTKANRTPEQWKAA